MFRGLTFSNNKVQSYQLYELYKFLYSTSFYAHNFDIFKDFHQSISLIIPSAAILAKFRQFQRPYPS